MAELVTRDGFAKYYESSQFAERVKLPPHANFHHYRIERWDGSFVRFAKTIRSVRQLVQWVSEQVPRNVYFTPTEWLDPSNVRRSRGRVSNYLLSSSLYFDIECEDGSISSAARVTSNVISYVARTRGRDPSWVIFSGRRGFHIYYWSWDDIPQKYGLSQDRIQQFVLTRKSIVQELEERGMHVDRAVTADPWRIMRLPGTLHGDTGLVAVCVSDPLSFSLEQANLPQEIDRKQIGTKS